jgi:RNA polymerase sigma factor (sigma-70 family)
MRRIGLGRRRLPEASKGARFEDVVLPHLDAAHNLARWLLRDDDDAADVVQDASIKALRFFGGFRGGDARAWLLTIVRNACFTWLRKSRPRDLAVPFDEEIHDEDDAKVSNPETQALRQASGRSIQQALEDLPVDLRETIVLRELEGLSYAEIAAVAEIPIGTVMSRLSRARRRLQQALGEPTVGKEVTR